MTERTFVPEIHKKVVEENQTRGKTRHYSTSTDGHRPTFEPFIPDASYADTLSGAVIKCVDIVVMDENTGEILVATRNQEPMAGKWVFGGRKRAGETNAETAIINMRREFGLEIDTTALVDTGHEYDEIWDTRSKAHITTTSRSGEPVTGSHTTSSAYILPLNKEQLDTNAYNEEFGAIEWVPFEDILNSKPGEYHPAVVDMVRDGIDALTTPDKPASIDEDIFRTTTKLSYLKAQIGRASSRYT
jgi:ADP-ribose pyrophosphatase YjhB (NUDIX family)